MTVVSGAMAPEGTSRVLRGLDGRSGEPRRSGTLGIEEHLELWGPLPMPTRHHRAAALTVIDESGLRGRGGAWFPASRKWRAAAEGRRHPVVVANGSEGEPASAKDATLLNRSPHLVLDGAMFAAAALDAARLVVFVPGRQIGPLSSALAERSRAGLTTVDTEIAAAPERYVTGEESAAVNYLNGGPAGKPTFTALRPVYRYGIAGGPTLVQNVETLAHAALIARFGAAWFRREGTVESPGTALLTLTGALATPRVIEVAVGSTVRSALARAGGTTETVQGVLLGGYGGTWVPTATALDTPLSPEALRAIGATFGPGVVHLVPDSACPVAQVAGLARWMAGQGAGQCGPCSNGLPALASVLEAVALGRAKKDALDDLPRLCSLVERRGACHHPDGVARMVRSAVTTFRADFDEHLRRRGCGRSTGLLLPTRPISGGAPRSTGTNSDGRRSESSASGSRSGGSPAGGSRSGGSPAGTAAPSRARAQVRIGGTPAGRRSP